MDKRINRTESIPCFYAAVVLYFPIGTPQKELNSLFPDGCLIKNYEEFNRLEVTVCEVDNIFCWEVADVLTLLFKACDLNRITAATALYKGSVFIDISFTHKERYPVLIFDGHIMGIIHQLQASIGIDTY